MPKSRTFVSFSSTDISSFRLIQAWNANESHNFEFIDCQLHTEIRSEDEAYIKSKCRERINMASTMIVLIGEDTRFKHKFVKWELEVGLEKKCRMICVNLDGSKTYNAATCPTVLNNVGAVFVPFKQKIIMHALNNYEMNVEKNYSYTEDFYRSLGL